MVKVAGRGDYGGAGREHCLRLEWYDTILTRLLYGHAETAQVLIERGACLEAVLNLLLYWYKSTNTDAKGAARSTRTVEHHSCGRAFKNKVGEC